MPVVIFLQQIPVQFPFFTPFPELSEILSHKQQFLARMSEHKGISRLQVLEFLFRISRHLVDHRTLQMYDFIVGKHQNIILCKGVRHREGHLVMVVFSEVRIQFHVIQKIMHPSHIPFQREAKSIFLHFSGHLRPCSRLLRDHHGAFVSSKNQRVQVLKELNRLQILISAVFVRHPLAILFSVIQIQHGCHRIHAKTIHMVFLNPVQGIGKHEILHFILSIVEDLGSPVRMFALPRISIFVQSLAVEFRQSMSIFREVCRYPVEDDADLVFVEIVHQIFEFFRRSIAGSWRIISRYLISPGTIKRMLRNTHQLYMSIPHLLDIVGQRMSKLNIIVKTFRIRL